MNDNLGNRMKEYEAQETNRRFMPLLPVYARIDGRAFHAFTHNMLKPYDMRMTEAMLRTAEGLVTETHAKIGYTQSDEISLVWYNDTYEGAIFFDGKIFKITSVLASLATALFCREMKADIHKLPCFDCRVFQLPNKTEAANALLWREMDATKNAISSAARCQYSHKALQGKTGAEMQEMLFAKGINFNDYPTFFKRGTFVRRETKERVLSAEELAKIPEAHRPAADTKYERSEIVRLNMPKFSSVVNRVEVVFDGAEPRIAT